MTYGARYAMPTGRAAGVHRSMLDGRRNVMIQSKEPRIVRIDPAPKAKPMLKVEPEVIARLVECDTGWCRIQVSGRKGWIEKKYLWGVYPREIIE